MPLVRPPTPYESINLDAYWAFRRSRRGAIRLPAYQRPITNGLVGRWNPSGTSGKGTSGMVGRWKLDEITGGATADPSFTDSSYHGLTAAGSGSFTGTSTVPSAISSFQTRAAIFDGTVDADLGTPSSLQLGASSKPVAWVGWFKRSVTDGGAYTFIGSNNTGWGFYLSSSKLALGKIGTNEVLGNTTVTETTTWHHGAVTYDQTTARFYLDGAADGTPAYSTDLSASTQKKISAVNGGGGWVQKWNGHMADVRVYNLVLSATQVSDLNSGATETNGKFLDSTANANHGWGAADWDSGLPTGMSGTSLKFNGTTDLIRASDSGYPSSTSSRTICFWAYPTAVDGTYHIPVAYGTFTTNQLFAISINSSNKWAVSQYGSEVQGNTATANTWTHVAVTYDGTTYRIYENGSESNNGTMTTSTTLGGIFMMGCEVDRSSPYAGKLKDIRIYNRALSAAEVLAIKNLLG